MLHACVVPELRPGQSWHLKRSSGLNSHKAACAQLVDMHQHIHAACIRRDETEAFLPIKALTAPKLRSAMKTKSTFRSV